VGVYFHVGVVVLIAWFSDFHCV